MDKVRRDMAKGIVGLTALGQQQSAVLPLGRLLCYIQVGAILPLGQEHVPATQVLHIDGASVHDDGIARVARPRPPIGRGGVADVASTSGRLAVVPHAVLPLLVEHGGAADLARVPGAARTDIEHPSLLGEGDALIRDRQVDAVVFASCGVSVI